MWMSGVGKPRLQKSTFAETRFLMISGSIFHDLGWSWDQLKNVALESGLKFDGFSCDSGVTPDPGTPGL